jgi:hypothetical protein
MTRASATGARWPLFGEERVRWTAVPRHWFSRDFDVQDQDAAGVGELRMSAWRASGSLVANGQEYRIVREGFLRTSFRLEGPEGTVARARRPNALRSTLEIEYEGRILTLRQRSIWSSERVLEHEGRELGSISATGLFSWKAAVALPPSLPLPLRLFASWLTVLDWQRDASHG